jgi:hypothetical protein
MLMRQARNAIDLACPATSASTGVPLPGSRARCSARTPSSRRSSSSYPVIRQPPHPASGGCAATNVRNRAFCSAESLTCGFPPARRRSSGPMDRRRWRGGRGNAMSRKGIVVLLLALLGLPSSMGAALLLHHPSGPRTQTAKIAVGELAPRQQAGFRIEPIEPGTEPVERAKPRARRSVKTDPALDRRLEPGP